MAEDDKFADAKKSFAQSLENIEAARNAEPTGPYADLAKKLDRDERNQKLIDGLRKADA